MAAAPPARAQGQAALAPPHSDYGVDFDADGQFNVLRIDVSLTVTVAGWFYVLVDLYDNSGMVWITSGANSAILAIGPGVIAVDLAGLDIRTSMFNGPYVAQIAVYDDMFTLDDFGVHLTQAYAWTDFEQPGLTFAPPHADSAFDTDGDILYDVLRVSWSVDVLEAGEYDFSFDLYDIFFAWIDSAFVRVTLGLGPQTVDADFTGWRVNANGVNGPFTANAYAYDPMGNYVGGDSHATAGYPWSAFELPPLQFAPPHADGVEDLDGDGLFNVLDVNWSVDVAIAGDYQFTVALFDPLFNWIDQVTVIETLSTGPQVVTTGFPGWVIRQSGFDGPYTAMASAYNATGDPVDDDVHTTGPYMWGQFETPPALLDPPHADAGVDTDGDMLYNRIDIDVHVLVDEPGDYVVYVLVTDLLGMTLLGFNATPASLAAGPQTVTLGFSTIPMQAQGIPGPYVAAIDLYTAGGRALDSGFHFTQMYGLVQFDPLPAAFAPPHWDQGVDRDLPPDGMFNVLEATVNLSVSDAGTFAVLGELWDNLGTTLLGQDVFIGGLGAGAQSVVLGFSGTALRAAGIDGPYRLDLTLYAIAGVFPVVIDTDTHVTRPYLWTEFQSVVPATLSGTVRDRPSGLGIDGAQVVAFDYVNEAYLGANAGPTGAYTLPLYEGDWVVDFDDWEHNAELQRVTLTGDTVIDADLWPDVPTTTTVDIAMPTWTAADLSVYTVEEQDNRTFRLFFDWDYGNRDQVLSQQEFDAILALFGFTPPAAPADTVDSFLVDGAAYGLVGGSDAFQFLGIPGPIDSTTPPASQLTASYANASIAPAWTHTIDMSVDYDQDWESMVYAVTLPTGFLLQSYAAPPTVAVSGVGSGVAIVDPGLDPNPFDMVTSVWIRLDVVVLDTTDPTVASAGAAPDPSLLGQPVTVTALATDDHAVASVRLEVWDPSGALVLNVTMTDMGMNTYAHTFTPAGVGTYDFTVTATDIVGNTGSRSGTFNVIELNPPLVVGASATPDPQGSGLPVLIAANVTDDTAVSSVSVAVRDAGGALIGNYTMALNATSGDYEVTQSFLDVGTLAFTVWATDPFGNVGSASGTFVVEDRTPPAADAGPDETVMAGVAVTFDGTGSTDNDRIAGYWWNFTDGGAQSLTGATPSYTFDTPGNYTVTLTVVDSAGNADTDLVTIVVTAAVGAVEGTVTGTASAPVAGATVRLMDGTTEVDTTTTDASGDYDFADVPPGTYTVSVTAAGYDAATRDVTVVAGQTATVDVQLTATPTGIGGLPSWMWILLLVVLVVGGALAFLLWRRRKPAIVPPEAPAPVAPPAPPPSTSPPPEAPAAPPTPEAPPSPPP